MSLAKNFDQNQNTRRLTNVFAGSGLNQDMFRISVVITAKIRSGI